MSSDTVRNFTWRREQISEGDPVVVWYKSVRDDSSPKKKQGFVTQSIPIRDNRLQFWFFDTDENSKIEVDIRETLGESVVRSKGSKRWVKIGDPVKVVSHPESETVEDLHQRHLVGQRVEQFETLITISAIRWNEDIIESMPTFAEASQQSPPTP